MLILLLGSSYKKFALPSNRAGTLTFDHTELPKPKLITALFAPVAINVLPAMLTSTRFCAIGLVCGVQITALASVL